MCLQILALVLALATPPRTAPAAPRKPVQVAYLDCSFDSHNVYQCKP